MPRRALASVVTSDQRYGPCSKRGEAREWQVSLVFPRLILRSAIPSHNDNPTLTEATYHEMLRRIRGQLEPLVALHYQARSREPAPFIQCVGELFLTCGPVCFFDLLKSIAFVKAYGTGIALKDHELQKRMAFFRFVHQGLAK